MDNRVTMLIASPDEYADVFKVFLKCLDRYWDDCPFEIVLSTNNGDYENIKVLNNGKTGDGWMDRALPAINTIRSEYILLICDDCLVTKKADNTIIDSIVNDMDRYQLDFVGLSNKIKGKKLYKNSYVDLTRMNAPYALNLQCGFFRRKFLLDELGDGKKTPWEIESKWLEQSQYSSGSFYPNIGSANIDVLGIRNGVLKGKWYYSVVDNLMQNGIMVDRSRQIMTKTEERKYLLQSKVGKMLPTKLRPVMKRIIGKFGYSFTTKY